MAEINAARVLNQPHTPMRFVNDEKLLNVNKRFCKDECEYFMRVPATFIPDFMIVRDSQPIGTIKTMELINYDTGLVEADMTDMTYADPVTIFNVGTKDYILYRGLYDVNGVGCVTPNLKNQMTCGQKYFIRIDDYVSVWTSEPFIACNPSFINTAEVLADANFSSLGAHVTYDNTTGKLCKNGGGDEIAVLQVFTACAANSYYKIEFDIDDNAFNVMGASLSIFHGRDTTTETVITVNDSRHVVIYDAFAYYILQFNAQFFGCISNIEITQHDYNICGSMRLEWTSACDVLDMYNGRGHLNRFWFENDTELGEPEYRFVQEGHENGDKRFIADFKKRTKRYKIDSELVPEHIIDALSDIPFFDTIKLYLKDDMGYELLEDNVMTEKWQFSGCYATMEHRFGIKDDAAETNCCASLEVPPCLTGLACRTDVIGDLDVFMTPDEGGIYFQYGDPNLIEYHVLGNISIPCDTGVFFTIAGGGLYYYWEAALLQWWPVTGDITQVTKPSPMYNLSNFIVNVQARIKDGLFARIEISIDGGATWNATSILGYTSAQLLSGVNVDAGAQEFKIRLNTYTLNCAYGTSAEHDVLLVLRAKIEYGAVVTCSVGHAITSSYYVLLDQAGINQYLGSCDLASGGHVALDDEAGLTTKIAACFGCVLSFGIVDDVPNLTLYVDLYNEIFTSDTQMTLSFVSILDDFSACGSGSIFISTAIFS